MNITLRRILKSTKLSLLLERTNRPFQHNIMRSLIGLVIFALSLFSWSNTSLAQCTLACNSGLQLSLDGNGEALISLDLVMPGTACDPADFALQVMDASGNNIPSLINCNVVGTTISFTVTEIATSNYCSGTIIVSDYLNPSINCVDQTIFCVFSAHPDSIGYPTVTDNCAILNNNDLSYTDQFIDLACFTTNGTDSITSRIERTWTVQDDFGNTDTCIQNIYFKRATVDDIDFPANRDGFAHPKLDCSEDPTDLDLTGRPLINGKILDNAGNCELAVSYSDQEIAICGLEAKRVIRTWTAIDWCTNEVVTYVQLIESEDTIAPIINCPADIVSNTGGNSCTASIFLPTTTATDDCSNVSITPTWIYGTGYGPFYDVSLGTHIVTYTATDDCGNSASCTMTITIEDNTSPVMVCKQGVDINLGSSGNAIVTANTFDDGSYDNCSIDRYEVGRDGINFNSTINFDCTDIENSPVMVYFRIFDVAGNYNQCLVQVNINDNINPAILCPSDININCTDNYTNLSITGEPIAADNCMIDTTYYNDQLDISSCGVGTIIRTWTTIDVYGNTNSCIQNITIEDNSPVTVSFPGVYTTYECGANTFPSITGEPTIMGDDCESVGISHTDNVFNIAAPACYKILRNWVVVDWCTFDPNSGTNEGYWTYTQIINVFDNEAPVITCPQDKTVGITSSSCGSTYTSFETAFATDCNPNVTITNDSPFADVNGPDASGAYPIGVHVINYTATDGCGNESSCQMTLIVEDATPPTPVCVAGIALSLSADGSITIPASLIDYGSYDNCSASENLTIELIPNTFTCADIGQQAVNLYVTDENGNTDFCTAMITIQDNLGICPNLTNTVAGSVVMASNEPLDNVEMELKDVETMSDQTDIQGDYAIEEVPTGGTYSLTPKKDLNIRNGISTLDVLLIQKHILGLQVLDSPYKILAADVNQSGSVTGVDLVLVRKMILYIIDSFPNNESWRFVHEDYVFPHPTYPFYEPLPESIMIENLQEDIYDANFVAIKSGDVNLSASSGFFNANTTRSTDDISYFETKDQVLQAGEIYEIDFKLKSEKELAGFQFTLNFDKDQLEFIDIVENENINKKHFGLNQVDNGFINSSWTQLDADTEENKLNFTIKFKAKSTAQLSELIKISSRYARAEAYDKNLEISDVKLHFEKEEIIIKNSTEIKLLQNTPNPFINETTITFILPQASTAILSITDISGRIVYQKQQQYAAGRHELRLNREDLQISSGTYVYQLITDDGQLTTKKMVVQ